MTCWVMSWPPNHTGALVRTTFRCPSLAISPATLLSCWPSWPSRSRFICPSSVRYRARRPLRSAALTCGASAASSDTICFSRSSSCFWYWSALTLSLSTRCVSTIPTGAAPHRPAVNAAPTASSPTRTHVMPASSLPPDAGDELVGGIHRARRDDRLGEHRVPPLLLGQRRRLDPQVGQDHREDPRPLKLDPAELFPQRAEPGRLGLKLRFIPPLRLARLRLARGVHDRLLLSPQSLVELRLLGGDHGAHLLRQFRRALADQALPFLGELVLVGQQLGVRRIDPRLLKLLEDLLVGLFVRRDLLIALAGELLELLGEKVGVALARLHGVELELEVKQGQPVLRHRLLLELLGIRLQRQLLVPDALGQLRFQLRALGLHPLLLVGPHLGDVGVQILTCCGSYRVRLPFELRPHPFHRRLHLGGQVDLRQVDPRRGRGIRRDGDPGLQLADLPVERDHLRPPGVHPLRAREVDDRDSRDAWRGLCRRPRDRGRPPPLHRLDPPPPPGHEL